MVATGANVEPEEDVHRRHGRDATFTHSCFSQADKQSSSREQEPAAAPGRRPAPAAGAGIRSKGRTDALGPQVCVGVGEAVAWERLDPCELASEGARAAQGAGREGRRELLEVAGPVR